MENFDKLNDNFMSEILGLENEYDILNKQAKVCTLDIYNNKSTAKQWFYQNTYFDIFTLMTYNNLIFLNHIIDPRRDRKMVYERRLARSQTSGLTYEKGL